jgi:hypothetical protein
MDCPGHINPLLFGGKISTPAENILLRVDGRVL